jgi:hypothetical protein
MVKIKYVKRFENLTDKEQNKLRLDRRVKGSIYLQAYVCFFTEEFKHVVRWPCKSSFAEPLRDVALRSNFLKISLILRSVPYNLLSTYRKYANRCYLRWNRVLSYCTEFHKSSSKVHKQFLKNYYSPLYVPSIFMWSILGLGLIYVNSTGTLFFTGK